MRPNYSLDQLRALATRITPHVVPGDVLALHGNLGTGKTTFAQAFISTLCADAEAITSPTFSLVQHYPPHLWHFDLYRLNHADEVWETGIEEAFHSGISLIEWPEIIADYLPPHTLHLTLAYAEDPNKRHITLAQNPQHANEALWQSLRS